MRNAEFGVQNYRSFFDGFFVILSEAKDLIKNKRFSHWRKPTKTPHSLITTAEGWEKVVQSVQTEPKGYPKLYDGTARGEVCAEQNA